MSADVIPFPQGPDGNGAREALGAILSDSLVKMQVAFDNASATDAILIRLEAAGFVIVPIEEGLR